LAEKGLPLHLKYDELQYGKDLLEIKSQGRVLKNQVVYEVKRIQTTLVDA